MKKILLLLFVMIMTAGMAFAAPTFSGAEGYIAMPRVDAAHAGRFGLSLKYNFSGLITPAINIVPFSGFEIGLGWDLNVNGGMNPFLANVKFQFVKQAALGFMMEIPTASPQDFHGTIYLAWEELLSASGIVDSSATFAVGYTFNHGSDINFFVGIQRNLFIPMLYLVADFSNFPYRFQGFLPHADSGRGILNIGLRLVLAPWLSFDVAGLDLFDGNRSWMIGANFYVALWGGGNK
ncbi:MAG: hypothetical protein A2Y33_01310 [Spirochaetes bacterium GWF1_51_8]|nr:MAG: hypothetical protein A2Y33_01310 [Spirochaetes bacterium GWF1_51_8]